MKSERRRCVPAITASLLSGCKWLQGVNSKTAPLLKFPGRANRKRLYNYSLLPLQYVPPEHYSTALLRRKKEKKKKEKKSGRWRASHTLALQLALVLTGGVKSCVFTERFTQTSSLRPVPLSQPYLWLHLLQWPSGERKTSLPHNSPGSSDSTGQAAGTFRGKGSFSALLSSQSSFCFGLLQNCKNKQIF